MSEIFFPKLKLKRKRSSADPEPCTGKERSVRAEAPAVSEAPRADTGPAPASAPDSSCPRADAMWALTLGWVLQELQEPSGQVPELPPPSARVLLCPSAAHWGLSHEEEVAPFPEFSSSAQSYPETDPTRDTALTPRSPQAAPTPHSLDMAPLLQQTETWAPKDVLPQSQKGRGTLVGAKGTGGTSGGASRTEGTGGTSGGTGRTKGTGGTSGGTSRTEGTGGTSGGASRTEGTKGTGSISGGVSRTEGTKGTRGTSGGASRTEGTRGTSGGVGWTEGTGGTSGGVGRTEGTGGISGGTGRTEGTKGTGGTSGCTGRTEGTKGTGGTSGGTGRTEGTKGTGGTSGGTGRTEGTKGTGVTKAAEELLASCPMCLLLFPPGFSQLERDSHLAQCLSDVNIDVTW